MGQPFSWDDLLRDEGVRWDITWGATSSSSRPPQEAAGFIVLSVGWQERDGQMKWRLPNMDAYQMGMVMRVAFIPGVPSMTWLDVEALLKSQAHLGAQRAFAAPPPEWRHPLFSNLLHLTYPSTMFYTTIQVSGLVWHQSKKGSSAFASLCESLAQQAVYSMADFLKPKLLDPSYPWMEDPSIHIHIPEEGGMYAAV